MKKRRIIIILCVTALLITVLGIAARDTKSFKKTEYTVNDKNLPTGFDGFKIAMVSDLHNATFGEGNSKLLSALEKAEPDIIAITGDLVDSSHTDLSVALDFAEKSVKIAPSYYVSGNHEAWLSEEVYEAFIAKLKATGVTVLTDEKTDIVHNGDTITLAGVSDPDFADADYIFESKVGHLTEDSELYTLLLSHRPEFFDVYHQCGVNLVLSGHTHAGQIRLPLIGAFIAPGQGFFPEYDKGIFIEDDTTMIVSAGLGNSVIPFRFCNQAELVIITLKAT
ncbi:MAG: metallophosphoesterase [Clostridia bacterium]|nr:metallophosphoesterase [Clostridia bacterium]